MEFFKPIPGFSRLRLSTGMESQQSGSGAPSQQPPWKSHSVSRTRNLNGGGGGGGGAVGEDIVQKARNIFNRITTQNSDKMVEQFLLLEFEGADKREGVMADSIRSVVQALNTIIQKCIREGYPLYLEAYAQMIRAILDHVSGHEYVVHNFRKQVLDLVQMNFQKYCGELDEQEIRQLEEILAVADNDNTKSIAKINLDKANLQARKKAVGNIYFIGQLYQQNMLSARIIAETVVVLLGLKTELAYECICELLTMVGQQLEKQVMERSRPTTNDRQRMDPNILQRIFMVLKSVSTALDNNLSPRVRFALMNVCELRDNGWRPRAWRLEQATSILVPSMNAAKQLNKKKKFHPPEKAKTNADDAFIKTILEQFERTQEIDVPLVRQTFNFGTKGKGVSSFPYLVRGLSVMTVSMDDEEPKAAGRLVKYLLQQSLIKRSDAIHGIRKVFLQVLRKPTDPAKTVRNLANFLVEIFQYDSDLSWLVELKASLDHMKHMKAAFTKETLKALEERQGVSRTREMIVDAFTNL